MSKQAVNFHRRRAMLNAGKVNAAVGPSKNAHFCEFFRVFG